MLAGCRRPVFQKIRMEQWKSIAGWEGLYQVSNFGRVRNEKTGHIKPQTKNNRLYLCVNLDNGILKTRRTVHRLVALSFCANPDNKPIVAHEDENQENNFAWNLTWKTQKENVNQSINSGRSNPKKAGLIGLKNRWNL